MKNPASQTLIDEIDGGKQNGVVLQRLDNGVVPIAAHVTAWKEQLSVATPIDADINCEVFGIVYTLDLEVVKVDWDAWVIRHLRKPMRSQP